MKKILSLLLAATMLMSFSVIGFAVNMPTFNTDRTITLADPAPWNLDELKQVVDITDPGSVAAYFVWAVARLTENYNDGMAMMKYLYADIEVYGKGFTEGGMSGKAGWDTYFNDRLKDKDYNWLPGAYFEGASSSNGFRPTRPFTVKLYFHGPDTETLNDQSKELGRTYIVYYAQSNAGSNKANLYLTKFEDSDRWYVTNSGASSALFVDQRAALTNAAKAAMASNPLDSSTEAEHQAKYGGATAEPTTGTIDISGDIPITINALLPFTDVDPQAYYVKGIQWAYNNKVTSGTTATTFGPQDSCTRGQVATFLWRAAGSPEPLALVNPFTDVFESDYYYKPILWAVENGITAGTSSTTFSPNQTCSSAHIITFLYRAMDMGSDGWYQEAKTWASGEGLLEGTGIQVDPKENCPRGAVVTFLERAYGK